MDPDLTKNKKYSGQGVDVWALGVILYLLLTGGIPFWGETEQDLYMRIQSAKYSLPKTRVFSKNLKKLLESIFKINVKERITAQ